MAYDSTLGYLIDPLASFFDDAETPIVGGYIRVFAAGTSSRAETFANFSRTPNGEKIYLDDAGRVTIIASKANRYKVMLCDESHDETNPLKVVDNVYGYDTSDVKITGAVTSATATLADDFGELGTPSVTATLNGTTGNVNFTFSKFGISDLNEKITQEVADRNSAVSAEEDRAKDAETSIRARIRPIFILKIFDEWKISANGTNIDLNLSAIKQIMNANGSSVYLLYPNGECYSLSSYDASTLYFTSVDGNVIKNITYTDADGFVTEETTLATIDALTSEASARSAADTALQSVITTSISQETNNRVAADNTLQAAITAEVTRAKSAEELNEARVAGEVVRARAAERELSTSIDNHKADTDIHVTDDDKAAWNSKLSDAPNDGKQYARKGGEWSEVVGGSDISEHIENQTIHVTANDKSTWNAKLSDAPSDNKSYARKNGSWTEVENGNTFTYVVYNTTPTSDVADAVIAGKTLRMVDDSYDNITLYADVYTITESGIKFVAIVDNGTDEYITEYTCNWEDDTWTKTTRTSPLEAPINGKMYGRKNGSWVEVEGGSTITVDQSYNSSSQNPQSGTAVAEALTTLSIPTSTSDLTNDSNFVSSVGITNIQVVDSLPASPVATTLYLIRE